MRALLIATALAVAVPAAAQASPGFTVPSHNTTCAVLGDQVAGARPGLYCSSRYITEGGIYDGVGVVRLGRTGKARFTGGGSDLLNYIGGYNGEGVARSKRPVLAYGEVFEKRGYRCKSRDTGLTCRRNGHGFFLSREHQKVF
jgi:hypothetical protein